MRTLHAASFLATATLLLGPLLLTGCGGSADPEAARTQPPATQPVPTVTLNASSLSVAPGESVTLSWAATHATQCTASGAWSGSRPAEGTEASAPLTAQSRFELTCQGPGGQSAASLSVATQPASSTARFPLRIQDRYLVEASGTPFLIHGDTAWSIIVQLDREGVEKYLTDRRARGFNTLLINLIEHRFSSNPPANVFGAQPFLKPGDFSTPNEAYFAHADFVLKRAEELGFAVLLVPAYLGFEGGEEGFYRQLLGNSDEVLRGYGRYIGTRYQGLRNIIWTWGGDYDPPEKRTVLSIVEGLRAVNQQALGTAHNGPETSPVEFWGSESWLQINNVYTLEPVYIASLREYERWRIKPFFLMEAAYENERGINVKRTRTQAWHALLSGAAGHVFGNSPIWHFDAPVAPFPSPVKWPDALGQPGTVGMMHLWDVFSTRRWWTLEPDGSNETLIGGMGEGHQRAVAAVASDKSFAIAYVPDARTIQVDLERLAGPFVRAVWVQAATGMHVTAAGSPFRADGAQSLTTPPNATADADDWGLLLDSVPDPANAGG